MLLWTDILSSSLFVENIAAALAELCKIIHLRAVIAEGINQAKCLTFRYVLISGEQGLAMERIRE